MKLTVSLVALSAATVATADLNRNHRHHQYVQRRDRILAPRQGVSSAPAVSSRPPAAASTPVAVSTPAAVTPAPVPTTPTVAGSIIPPLEQITSGAPIATPLTMFTTYAAGATPSLSGAPALPTFAFSPTTYPPLDVVPDVASPQVKQWLSEIDLTKVPNLSKTVDGSCDSDPAAAADTKRCWWTCGGCTRPDDVVVCPNKNDWGMTYDDGPSPYTPKLINYLHAQNLTATFYVVGSRVVSRPEMLQTEYMQGHEISIHTWSHHPLTTLTNEQIVAELGWTRQAIKDVIGVSPTTMRPPYGDIDDRVRAVVKAMGLTPVIWTGSGANEFDTKDWQIPGGGSSGPASFAAWQRIVSTAGSLTTGFITLQHDLYQQSVDLAVGYIVPDALKHTPKFNIKSVAECLHNGNRGEAYAELKGKSTGAGGSTGGSGGSTGSGGSSGNGTGGAGNLPAGASMNMGVSLVAGALGVVGCAAAALW